MATDQRTRAQHYVPQFILRGFTNSKKKMFCYDKVSGRVYATCPADAAQERDFYECPPGTTKEPMEVNAVENQLGKVESAYRPILDRLIKAADVGRIDPDLLDHTSPFVALQWMRTKTYRDTAYETIVKAGQAIVDDLTRLNFPDVVRKVRFSVGKAGMAAFHAEHMLNPETLLRMARDLDRHIWVVGVNRTESLFYISDHPVVRRGNRRDGNGPMVGVRDPGIEFAFPLDSRHVLLILERTHFAAWRRHDGCAIDLTLGQIADYNGLQVKRSCQRVYCANDDFDLARRLCAEDASIRDPNRPRMRVWSTPIVNDGDTKKNYTLTVALE